MNKKERDAAAYQIRTAPCFTERFETRLPCGMIVRCNNTLEARDSCAAKFEKFRKPRSWGRYL